MEKAAFGAKLRAMVREKIGLSSGTPERPPEKTQALQYLDDHEKARTDRVMSAPLKRDNATIGE